MPAVQRQVMLQITGTTLIAGTNVATTGATTYTQTELGSAAATVSGGGTGAVSLTNVAPSFTLTDTQASTYALTVTDVAATGGDLDDHQHRCGWWNHLQHADRRRRIQR